MSSKFDSWVDNTIILIGIIALGVAIGADAVPYGALRIISGMFIARLGLKYLGKFFKGLGYNVWAFFEGIGSAFKSKKSDSIPKKVITVPRESLDKKKEPNFTKDLIG